MYIVLVYMHWLTSELKQKVKDVFESRYNRKLSDNEIITIVENLTGVMESILKIRWKNTYENLQNKRLS